MNTGFTWNQGSTTEWQYPVFTINNTTNSTNNVTNNVVINLARGDHPVNENRLVDFYGNYPKHLSLMIQIVINVLNEVRYIFDNNLDAAMYHTFMAEKKIPLIGHGGMENPFELLWKFISEYDSRKNGRYPMDIKEKEYRIYRILVSANEIFENINQNYLDPIARIVDARYLFIVLYVCVMNAIDWDPFNERSTEITCSARECYYNQMMKERTGMRRPPMRFSDEMSTTGPVNLKGMISWAQNLRPIRREAGISDIDTGVFGRRSVDFTSQRSGLHGIGTVQQSTGIDSLDPTLDSLFNRLGAFGNKP